MVGIRKYSLGIFGRDTKLLNISGPHSLSLGQSQSATSFPSPLNWPIILDLPAHCAICSCKHREFKKKKKGKRYMYIMLLTFELIPLVNARVVQPSLEGIDFL